MVTDVHKIAFWSELMGLPSKSDNRINLPVTHDTPIHWGVVDIITKEEVEAALRSFGRTAAGPDGRTVRGCGSRAIIPGI